MFVTGASDLHRLVMFCSSISVSPVEIGAFPSKACKMPGKRFF